MDTRNFGAKELANALVDELYKNQNTGLLSNLSKRNYEELFMSREKLILYIRRKLTDYMNADGTELTEDQKDQVISFVRKELWGYGLLDEFIHDKDISDVKLLDYDSIRVKLYGKRYDAGVSFESRESYITFVTRLLERNKVNLGAANAIQTFTDDEQEDYILRITVMSGLLCNGGVPCISIRKIAKEKKELDDLEMAGMFDREMHKPVADDEDETWDYTSNEELNYLFDDLVNSRGVIFTGKGASGKTTLMNALISRIPHSDAVMICQENAELFDKNHPELIMTQVLVNSGDSKISYPLGELTRAALLMDVDRVIVGEVKEGGEAAGLSKASLTGHKCWTSVHGEDCEMALEKMADYISQATGYGLNEALRQLTGFEYVVHLKNFQVDEIVRIEGWDREHNCLDLSCVY